MPQICAFLVRAEAWLAHGVNNPAMALGMEDYASHVSMFAAGVRGVALPETLFSYRKRAGSMSKTFDAHGVAFLYRRIWQTNPGLFRRFGPELVGLHAENGHGALAPSVGEPSARHTALLGRDIPELQEVADRLEATASREQLGRALRARCWAGGAEWDYTTARLLLALDREPAFARSLLRSAVSADPQNGWFRLYAILAELRDGRIGAADRLWSDSFDGFCRAEAGAIGWIAELEAVRGFPHAARALRAWLSARSGVEIGAPPSHLEGGDPACSGEFASLHAALTILRHEVGRGRSPMPEAVEIETGGAAPELSPEAVAALIRRWTQTWSNAGLPGHSQGPVARPTYWGATAEAYLVSSARTASLTAAEAADRDAWSSLGDSPRTRLAPIVEAVTRRLRPMGLARTR